MRAPSSVAGVAHAYERVRAAIVENRHPPGHRLVEQRIAFELGLSRTPVREALRMLEAEGLVVSERNRGAVRLLSSTDVEDLYGLRIRLESYAVELATERSSETELGAIVEAADASPAAARSVDVAASTAPAPRGQPGAPRRHPPRRPPPPADDDAGAHCRHPARVQGVPVLRRDRDRERVRTPSTTLIAEAMPAGCRPGCASWPSTSPRATPSSTPSPPTPHDDLTTANTAIPGGPHDRERRAGVRDPG